MNRAEALALVQEWTEAPHLLRHMLAVEAAMRAYAERFGEDGEAWGLAGLIHDFDYEKYGMDGHVIKGVPILREKGVPEEILQTINAHYQKSLLESHFDDTIMLEKMEGIVTRITDLIDV